jgi:hypothetical protein
VYYRSEAYLTRGTHPEPLDSMESIEDRVCSAYGLNLYDAGTWSIALGLQNEFEVPEVYNDQILYSSTTGRMDDVGGIKDIRGDTDDFHYGKGMVTGSSLAMVRFACASKRVDFPPRRANFTRAPLLLHRSRCQETCRTQTKRAARTTRFKAPSSIV